MTAVTSITPSDSFWRMPRPGKSQARVHLLSTASSARKDGDQHHVRQLPTLHIEHDVLLLSGIAARGTHPMYCEFRSLTSAIIIGMSWNLRASGL